MSPSDTDPILLTGRLVVVVLSLFALGLGGYVVVSRRIPRGWLRIGRPTKTQRSRPARLGAGLVLVGVSLLIQQAPFLIPMPFALGAALLAAALLLTPAAGWLLWREARQRQ
ncbi:hypothetical protein ACSNN7_13450 [Micromonospora sp. URMC 105]|uniref:hypothetical protein n=1 Tax=Micromonospora sp. URMC 105 TaxID=3423413 RepID=UPI003F1C526F